MDSKTIMTDEEINNFLSLRTEAALQIDPETAEVDWFYVDPSDPYDIYCLPEEYRSIGRGYFARSPESDIWISFYDLPEKTRDALWKMHGRSLAFPSGIAELLQACNPKDA
jgi:hypothetical protein